ncbi:hypothetical protein [Micromonospora sp. NPDC049891]|uniref:hypothetical protein n=1 Tax=Micromonospora sp. NPDC049891 TaxID=3155655 RepID=UPI0033E6FB71
MIDSSATVITGAQEPTSWYCPPFKSSAVDEAIRLLEDGLGFRLFPWQKFLLEHIFGENEVSPGIWKWAAKQVVVSIPRQNGKSFLLDCIILVGLFAFGERIVLTAQNRDTAARAFLRIVALLEEPRLAFLRKAVKKVSKRSGNEFIETRNGGVFFVKTRGPDSARGLDAIDRLLQDEAYDLDDSDLQAIMPTVLASRNPQVLYFSTPPRNALIGEPFARLRQQGENKVDGVAYFIWGIDPKKLEGELDTSDRKHWTVNPSLGLPGGMPIENLAIMHGSLSPEAFRIECLGIWPEKVGTALITPEAWAALADPESRPAGDIAFAVDTCGWGDRAVTSICAYGVREDGLGHLELIDQRPGTDWVVAEVARLKEAHNPVAIGFDHKAPIGSLLIDLQKAGIDTPEKPDDPRYGELAIPGAQDFSGACIAFVDGVNNKTLHHRDQPELNRAITAGKPRKIGDSWGWDRFKSEIDISALTAATLARWAYESRSHLVGRTPNPGAYLF